MRQCPYCELSVEDNSLAEISHMNSAHPEVIAQRLHDAGFTESMDQFSAVQVVMIGGNPYQITTTTSIRPLRMPTLGFESGDPSGE